MGRLLVLVTMVLVSPIYLATALPARAEDDAPIGTLTVDEQIVAENRAARERMDAFEARLKARAERAILSVCTGCTSSVPVAAARPDREANEIRVRVELATSSAEPEPSASVESADPETTEAVSASQNQKAVQRPLSARVDPVPLSEAEAPQTSTAKTVEPKPTPKIVRRPVVTRPKPSPRRSASLDSDDHAVARARGVHHRNAGEADPFGPPF